MRVLLSAVFVVLVAAAAHGQTPPDFSTLKVKVGDVVYVTDAATRAEVNGPLTALSPSSLSIDAHRFEPRNGLTIDRRGDSIKNGTIIGLVAGAVAGGTIGAEACLDTPKWHCVVGGSITYGAIGALIDWLHKGRTRVYPRR